MADSTPPGPTLEPGATLDRYELLCTIARGGMAHVWLGRFKGKHGFEKLVAIKTILPEHALDDRFRKMFLDEARIASGIEHPNVAKILDLGEWRDSLYLVMEYVDGDSLSRLRRGVEKRNIKLPAPIALRILADVSSGLHAAHELRGDDGALLDVVHRDVSPQNVLVPVNGIVKVIDFGVAKAAHRLGEETGAGFAKGKSRYMSPEQALAKGVDRRADVFALGAMAYELFEGSAPYDGPNDMARLHMLITSGEVAPMTHAPSSAVAALIAKALVRAPEARFATAAQFRDAIEDAMLALKVRATPDDVAAFVATHTSDRITERKRVVKVAVDAALKRVELKEVVEQGSISGRKGEASTPALSPVTDIPIPAAYSASVHLPKQRPRWAIIAAAAVVASLFVIALALRNKGSQPQASTTTSAAATSTAPPAPSSVSTIPPPPPASVSDTLPEIDAGKPKLKSHATTSPTKHPKPHDVVIQ